MEMIVEKAIRGCAHRLIEPVASLLPQMARGGAKNNGPAPPIDRLGIGPYNWNTECLRGDVEAYGWATSYPQALGLAASFRYCCWCHQKRSMTCSRVCQTNHVFSLACFSPRSSLQNDSLCVCFPCSWLPPCGYGLTSLQKNTNTTVCLCPPLNIFRRRDIKRSTGTC